MTNEIFEYRLQARGPQAYFALGLALTVVYFGWVQGWGLISVFLCGPFLAMVLARLLENDAEGFRMTAQSLDFYDAHNDGTVAWRDLRGVTVCGDGGGGARCMLHLYSGQNLQLPATGAFSPDRLAQEFRVRNVPVWRAATADNYLVADQF